MSVRYRRATPADAAALAALGSTVWITTYCTEGVPRDYSEYVLAEFTAAVFAAAIAAPGAVFWVAETDGGLLAFGDLRLGERTGHLAAPDQAEVARLYVLERFARCGIGRTLLDLCRGSAVEAGVAELWLSVYAGNARARSFYDALGWRKVGDLAFELGGQAYPNDVLAFSLTGGS